MAFRKSYGAPRTLAALLLVAVFPAALLLAGPLALAQKAMPPLPTVPCAPSAAAGFDDLRVFNGTAPIPMAFHCGEQDSTACHVDTLDLAKPDDYQGDLIAPAAVLGPWTCAQVGGWFGYIPTNRVSPVPSTPAITTQQWLGTWNNTGVGRLVLSRSAAGHGILHIEGVAHYTNIAHNRSTGELSGDAVALGPFLHLVDNGQQSGCVLDLKYDPATASIRAVDNEQCGGHNVSFDGRWQRSKAH